MKDGQLFKNVSRIIINHINSGNLELNGICVNELTKDILSQVKEQELDLNIAKFDVKVEDGEIKINKKPNN